MANAFAKPSLHSPVVCICTFKGHVSMASTSSMSGARTAMLDMYTYCNKDRKCHRKHVTCDTLITQLMKFSSYDK